MGRRRKPEPRQVAEKVGEKSDAEHCSGWSVYLVECADGSLYAGIARDLQARIAAHNAGTGARYTRGRRPVSLVYSEPASGRSEASRREFVLKRLTRTAKQRLIAANCP